MYGRNLQSNMMLFFTAGCVLRANGISESEPFHCRLCCIYNMKYFMYNHVLMPLIVGITFKSHVVQLSYIMAYQTLRQ